MIELKTIREDAGLSQKEVAEIISVTQPYYSQIEVRLRQPSVKLAKEIARVFGFEWWRMFDE